MLPSVGCRSYLLTRGKASPRITTQRCFCFYKCSNTKQFWNGKLSKKYLIGIVLPAFRFEPRMGGYEARTLPLGYAHVTTFEAILKLRTIEDLQHSFKKEPRVDLPRFSLFYSRSRLFLLSQKFDRYVVE